LVIVILVLGFFTYKKAKKKQKNKKTTEKLLKEKSKTYSNRMKNLKKEEVKGRLGNV